MVITDLPFNRLVGLEAEPEDSPYLVSLQGRPHHVNHLGTLHAGVLFTVAEVGSAVFLQRQLGYRAGMVPVVRRVEAKYRRPGTGRVRARASVPPQLVAAWLAEFDARGRVWVEVPVEVVDAADAVVLTARIEWYIGLAPTAVAVNRELL